MARTAEASGTVIVSRRQLVTFTGRTLASVELTKDGLVVTKKRERGGRYDSHTFPLIHVVAFVEGDGGRREPAYAMVMSHTVLKRVSGDVTYDQGWIVVTDDEGNEHRFRATADTEVVVIEGAAKPERATRTKKKKATSARRRKADPDEDDDTEDGDVEDGDEDEDADGDGDDVEEGDEDDGEDPGEDEEADVDPDEDDEVEEAPRRSAKKGSGKKPAAKPARKVPAKAAGKPGRRISSF
jgi:hypothetical protein